MTTTADEATLTLEYNLTIAVRAADGGCDCVRYFITRRDVLLPEVLKGAQKRGVDPVDHFAAYARRVHARHEAGLSLATSETSA